MSYKAEVMVAGESKWSGNGLRFPTEAEAEQYARDLMGRWMMVTEWRVVEAESEANYKWDNEAKMGVKI